jgi:hypothetical protein
MQANARVAEDMDMIEKGGVEMEISCRHSAFLVSFVKA